MNDDSRAVTEKDNYTENITVPHADGIQLTPVTEPPIPGYLQDTYWWAYLHPRSFWFFEREWVVNMILWGNMRKLTSAVLQELDVTRQSHVLQVACVYGDFSNKLAAHLRDTDSRLSIVDVAPIQLQNVRKKLERHGNVSIHHQDSTKLSLDAGSVDETVVFFLLHEQPEQARRRTIAEAIRVTRPGGRVIFVDYHGPRRSNPMRYVMKPVLAWLEPFALDLWRDDLMEFLPAGIKKEQVRSTFFFGGLYQKVVVTLRD